MSIATPPRASTMTHARPPASGHAGHGPAGGSGTAAAVDPVRLLKQYKVPLAAAAIAGLVVGAGAHVVIKRFWPQYRSTVVYQAGPQVVDIKLKEANVDEREFDRFMQTQTRIMVADRVLREAVRDPALKNNPNVSWIRPYIMDNGQVDQPLAARDLKDLVSARAVTGTNLIELSVTAKRSLDAAVLVNAVHDAYWRDWEQQAGSSTADVRNALNRQITDLRAEIGRLEEQRTKILRDNHIDSTATNSSTAYDQLRILQPRMVELDSDRERFSGRLKQMEAQLRSETGPTYDDAMREDADKDSLITSIRSEVSGLTTMIEAKKREGYGTNHRSVQALVELLKAKQSELDSKREEVLLKNFQSTIDQLRHTIDSITAQRKELQTQFDQASRRNEDMTRLMADYEALGRQVGSLREKENEARAALQNIQSITEMRSADRIDRMRRIEPGRQPDDIAFPRLGYMLAAGFVLVVGLTGAVIVLREVLDQRIKGPSDMALLPRMRLLGMIPTANDDPAKPASPELAFKECSMGAMAESFRQLRPALVKRLQQGGHRSLLMVGAMPGSGTTTVAANFAMACAAADQRVLLVDANFRRPVLHKVFKLGEGPGLGDVLSRKAALDGAVQQTSVENLHLLSAGTAASRSLPERLTSESMTLLIREATEKYDLVLLDTAPAMVAGDAVALANRCDAVVLIVRAMAEKRGLVSRLRDQLADTRAEFMGVIINAVRASAGGYMRRNIRESFEYQNNGQSA